MRLEAIVTVDELTKLVRALTPMRIVLDERRGRAVTLGPPRVELVAGQGIRLRGDARITWDAFGLSVPITIQAWQVLLRPWITDRGRSRVLGFEPVIEVFDLKGVPSFVDGKITEGLENGIAKTRERLAWDFARTLSKQISLPARVDPSTAVSFDVVGGAVSVSASELRLSVELEARAERRARPATAAAPSSVRTTAPAVVMPLSPAAAR